MEKKEQCSSCDRKVNIIVGEICLRCDDDRVAKFQASLTDDDKAEIERNNRIEIEQKELAHKISAAADVDRDRRGYETERQRGFFDSADNPNG